MIKYNESVIGTGRGDEQRKKTVNMFHVSIGMGRNTQFFVVKR